MGENTTLGMDLRVFFVPTPSGFRGICPADFVCFQPHGELSFWYDPDAGALCFSEVAALKGRAENGTVVDEKRGFQHVLAVFQFQIVVVGEAALAARGIDVLVDQNTGVKLWQGLVPEMRPRGTPQR